MKELEEYLRKEVDDVFIVKVFEGYPDFVAKVHMYGGVEGFRKVDKVMERLGYLKFVFGDGRDMIGEDIISSDGMDEFEVIFDYRRGVENVS